MRRSLAWVIDVLVVGVPCAALGVVVPVIPVGALAWGCYRVGCAVTGAGLGRRVCRWRLTRRGARPGVRGVAHMTVAAAPLLLSGTVATAAVVTFGPDGWLAWLVAVVAWIGVTAAGAVTGSVVLWRGASTGQAHVDRWTGLTARRTVKFFA